MNNLIKAFFTEGYNIEIQECVLIYLDTVKDSLSKIDVENVMFVYMIDDINNSTYHIESIKQKCTIIKQQYLFKTLSTEDAQVLKEPKESRSEEKEEVFAFFKKYDEDDFVQPIQKRQ